MSKKTRSRYKSPVDMRKSISVYCTCGHKMSDRDLHRNQEMCLNCATALYEDTIHDNPGDSYTNSNPSN